MQLIDLTPDDPDVINVFSDIDRLINSLYPVATAQSLSVSQLGQPNVYAIGLKNEEGIVACGAIVMVRYAVYMSNLVIAEKAYRAVLCKYYYTMLAKKKSQS